MYLKYFVMDFNAEFFISLETKSLACISHVKSFLDVCRISRRMSVNGREVNKGIGKEL